MDVDHMLGNAATASQNATLIDCKVTRGAILRSIAQWLETVEGDIDLALFQLRKHEDFSE